MRILIMMATLISLLIISMAILSLCIMILTDADTGRRNNYLTLKLNGDTLNKDGLGTIVYAYSNGFTQMVEQYPARGYLSTVDNRLHFGFGKKSPDSIKIIWPDGKMQVIEHPGINKIMQVNYIRCRFTIYTSQSFFRFFFYR